MIRISRLSQTHFSQKSVTVKKIFLIILFTNHLMNNFAYFVVNVKAFSLCFNLLQENIFHNTQFEEVFDQHKRNRQEANRFLFAVLIGNEYTQEQLQNIWTTFRKPIRTICFLILFTADNSKRIVLENSHEMI